MIHVTTNRARYSQSPTPVDAPHLKRCGYISMVLSFVSVDRSRAGFSNHLKTGLIDHTLIFGLHKCYVLFMTKL